MLVNKKREDGLARNHQIVQKQKQKTKPKIKKKKNLKDFY